MKIINRNDSFAYLASGFDSKVLYSVFITCISIVSKRFNKKNFKYLMKVLF
jgi:hypothetical protein